MMNAAAARRMRVAARFVRRPESQGMVSRDQANSNIAGPDGFTAKAAPGTPEYKRKVAQPIMEAIDGMPSDYRELVREFDYIPVYLAWRHGWSVKRIRETAAGNGGRFDYRG